MKDGGTIIFWGFLLIAAWQDGRDQSVNSHVYIWAGGAGVIWRIISGQAWLPYVAGSFTGILLWVLCKVTRGAVGEGDAAFFVVSGMLLGIRKNLELLLWSLLLCGLIGGVILIWRGVKGLRGGGIRLPFLPFLLLPSLWLMFS